MGISVVVAGDGEAASPCLSPHGEPMSLGPLFLQLCLKIQLCSQDVTTAETSCWHQLAFWTCLGNENCRSYINTQVLHWDALRTGSVSPRAQSFPLANALQRCWALLPESSHHLPGFPAVQTRIKWKVPKSREGQSCFPVSRHPPSALPLRVLLGPSSLVSPWSELLAPAVGEWWCPTRGYKNWGIFPPAEMQIPWLLVSFPLSPQQRTEHRAKDAGQAWIGH